MLQTLSLDQRTVSGLGSAPSSVKTHFRALALALARLIILLPGAEKNARLNVCFLNLGET